MEAAYERFTAILKTLIDENIPQKCIKINRGKPVWWTRELQSKKNRRDKLYKRQPKGQTTNEYTEALKEFNELKEKLYTQHVTLIERNIRRYAKASTKSVTDYPQEMQLNGERATSELSKAQLFANHFEAIYERDRRNKHR